MNNSSFAILIAWQTRNVKRHRKALIWCKDYGFTQIFSNIAIGNLYERERRIFISKFKGTFTKKTDRFFHIKICQTCYNGVELGSLLKASMVKIKSFELIQLPPVEAITPRKGNKNRLLYTHVV